jgi:hypothetical protein
MGEYMLHSFRREDHLLHKALKIHKIHMNGDRSYFNILYAIGKERDETQVHSKIIYFLLTHSHNEEKQNLFLNLFLQVIKIPKQYLDDSWLVYRERVFENGRIDFVMESRNFCVAIEMKIDAGDGDSQLERYELFCKRKRKEYFVYYLTLDGHAPSEKSVYGMDLDKLRKISFQKEVVEWIDRCMENVDKDGYKHSFLKQYLGVVKHITGVDKEEINVEDLITDQETGKAAMLIIDSFHKKMQHVIEAFFDKLKYILEKESGQETRFYDEDIRQYYLSKRARTGTETVINHINYKDHIYYFVLCLEVDDFLYVALGFADEMDDAWIPLSEIQDILPDFYEKCMEKIDRLDLPGLKQSVYSRWYYLENTKGQKFDFRNYSDSVIELIDDMNVQCEFLGQNIANQILSLVGEDS